MRPPSRRASAAAVRVVGLVSDSLCFKVFGSAFNNNNSLTKRAFYNPIIPRTISRTLMDYRNILKAFNRD